MTALFGEGRHPNADVIERRLQREGVRGRALDRATKLGHAYHLFEPSEFQTALAARYREFNTTRGERPEAAVPAAERARIRTELAHEWFRAEHGRDPLDAREFTGYLTRISRPAPVPVAGYDLTFSPVKSVSALWAIAPRELAETIAACHDEAVRDTIGWLEKHAAYTRRGTNGIAQVDTTGLIAAAFTHRDSRAGDPDLHTHVAVSNKVCTADGRWLSLDGRALYRNKVAASEHYNTRLEALLTERVGVRFADRGDAADGKREVREIVGVDSGVAAPLVVAARRHRGRTRRPGAPVPGRARPPADGHRGAGAGPAGDADHPGGEARTALGGRATPHLERRRRRDPRRSRAGRRARAPGHRPRTRADADGRRRRPRPAGDRDRAGVAGHLAGASRARRGGAGVSPPCRRAGLSRRRGDRPRSVANELGSAHRAADDRRAAGAAARGRLVGVRGRRIPPLHVGRDPGRRAAHPGGGGVPGFPHRRERGRRPGAARSRRERRPTRPRPGGDGAAARDVRRAGAARARAGRQRKDSHPAHPRRRMGRGREHRDRPGAHRRSGAGAARRTRQQRDRDGHPRQTRPRPQHRHGRPRVGRGDRSRAAW